MWTRRSSWLPAWRSSSTASSISPGSRRPASGDDEKPLRKPAQVAAAVVGDRHEVLHPHPEPTGQVDPGLHRDHVSGLQDLIRLSGEARGLVQLEADAMPEPVAEP